MDMAGAMDNYYEAADNYLKEMHESCDIVENNVERPIGEGTYLTINSNGIEQETFFNGRYWVITKGQRPVVAWFKERKSITSPSDGAQTPKEHDNTDPHSVNVHDFKKAHNQ